jgi:DNA-binding PadR family transcriptional regulator
MRRALASGGRICEAYYVTRTNHRKATSSEVHAGYFPDPQLFILASLAEGPKHGHAMNRDITRMSGKRLGPGTLYGAIARLEREGLIEPLPPEERRYPYRLTSEGLRVLRARLVTLHNFARIGLRRIELT